MAQSTQTSAELKRAYAQAIMAEAAKKGNKNPVIVLPAFIDDELIEDECVVPSKKNPAMGYVSFYQVAPLATKNKRLDLDIEHWAISVGRVDRFEKKYHAGQILEGRIAIEEKTEPENPDDPEQDLKYASKECREAGVPCTRTITDENGKKVEQMIYQIKYYDPTGKAADVFIEHDNLDEIEEVNAAAKAASQKANSNGLRGAAGRARKAK